MTEVIAELYRKITSKDQGTTAQVAVALLSVVYSLYSSQQVERAF